MTRASISQNDTVEGHRITLHGRRWACGQPFIISVLLFGASIVVYRSIGTFPDRDPTGPTVFAWLLAGLAFGATLVGIRALRNRVSFLIVGRRIEIEERGLMTKRRVFDVPENLDSYPLVLTEWVSDHSSKRENATKEVLSLYLVDDEARLTLLLSKKEKQMELFPVANTLSDLLALGPPMSLAVGGSQSLEAVVRSAHLKRLQEMRDQGLEKMRDAVREMEASRDELVRGIENMEDAVRETLSSPDRLAAKVDSGKNLVSYVDRLEEMDREIDAANAEVQNAELQACAQDFDRYEFTRCAPGDLVEFQRLKCDPLFSILQILTLPGTAGMGIMIFFLTPFVVPLTGAVIAFLTDMLLTGVVRLQTRYAIADIFKFDVQLVLWMPVLFAFNLLWTWLKVDASFSPFRVRIDGSGKKVTINKHRSEPANIPFSSIRSVTSSVVHSAKDSSQERWKKFVMLSLESDTGTVPLLDREYKADAMDDDDGALNCVEPLASEIARMLGVPLNRDTSRTSQVDAIGYPYAKPFLHCHRIWRLAGTRVKRIAVGLFAATFILLAILFANRFQANRAEAERDYLKKQAGSYSALLRKLRFSDQQQRKDGLHC